MARPLAAPSGRLAIATAGVLASIPMIRMISAVRESSQLQYGDYWPMAKTLFRSDGGLNLAGVFQFRNQHPVVPAKLMYWLNYRLTGGSNHSLGYVVVVIVLLQLTMIAKMAGETDGLTRWHKVAIIVGSSALLFAPFGAWNFVLAMSGAAWLSANLFALGAIFIRIRRGSFWALPVGVLASISYGTGLAVWPALVLTGWARDRRLRSQWPTVVTGLLASVWYRGALNHSGSPVSDPPGMTKVARNTFQLVGSILSPDSVTRSAWLGGAAVAIVGVATIYLWIWGRPDAAPWIGIAAFGVGSATLIGLGRSGVFIANFTQSRYSSPAAIVWISVLALVTLALPDRMVSIVPAVAIALVATLAGGHTFDTLRDGRGRQDELAIAMHLDLADGNFNTFAPFPKVTKLIRSIHHYPFDGRWAADCGLLGRPVSPALIEPPTNLRSRGSVLAVAVTPFVQGGTEFHGWIDSAAEIDCLLVVNDRNDVVGVGTRDGRGASGSSFRALARTDESPSSVIVRFKGEATFERLPVSR